MELGHKLITLLLLCELAVSVPDNCTEEGSFPVPGSPESFNVCTLTNGKWNKITLKCPSGLIYSAEMGSCVANNKTGLNMHMIPFHSEHTCLYNGLYCADCNTMRVCVTSMHDKQLMHIRDIICPEGTTCSTFHQQCVPNMRCPIREFKCTDGGVFPDPYDCRKVHYCFNLIHLESECPVNEVFDYAGSGRCRRGAECARFPDCQSSFEMHRLPRTRSFYICTHDENNTTIAPEFYNCPEGLFFDETSMLCSWNAEA